MFPVEVYELANIFAGSAMKSTLAGSLTALCAIRLNYFLFA